MLKKERREFKRELELKMSIYADMLEFEKAAGVRDILNEIDGK